MSLPYFNEHKVRSCGTFEISISETKLTAEQILASLRDVTLLGSEIYVDQILTAIFLSTLRVELETIDSFHQIVLLANFLQQNKNGQPKYERGETYIIVCRVS